MWTYKQSTGEMLRPDGTRLAFGFAGNGEGLNEPLYQSNHGVGPLPQGMYTMTSWIENDAHTGMCTIVLVMDPGQDRRGRDGFRIHGAVSLASAGLTKFLHSSDGCIILGDCILRRGIWANADKKLKVVA